MTMPAALEAERELLGAALVLPEAWPEVAALTADDFLDPIHRRTYEAMQALSAVGTPLDSLTVSAHMQADGDRTPDLLVQLTQWSAAAVGVHLQHHVKLVQRAAGLRRLAMLGETLRARAMQGDVTPEDLAADVRTKLAGLETTSGAGPVRLGDQLGEVFDVIAERSAHPERHLLETGIEAFDSIIGGLQGGRLALTAARPGEGKTSWAACVAANCAVRGTPVLFFSLEETTQQVAERVIGMLGDVTVHRINKGLLGYDEYQKLYRRKDDIGRLPFWVDSAATRLASIVAEARRWRAQQQAELGLIVVDYISLVKAPAAERRDLEVGMVGKEFKRLAKETGYVVIAVAQLNRRNEQEQREPRLSDLRESGELEADADFVVMPHRTRPVNEAGPVDLLVLKNRGSVTGRVTVEWLPETMQYK